MYAAATSISYFAIMTEFNLGYVGYDHVLDTIIVGHEGTDVWAL